jgi:hypothetical protein
MTPLERAARALCKELNLPPDFRSGGDPFAPDPNRVGGGLKNWEAMLPHVRAVLTAIREPDEAMMSAAVRAGQASGYTDIIAVHRAIIDAALAEEG